ncbi:MAG: vanadium-dependent haloperoxidase [Saprospiraceae bacterium]|nr:vanadium-dependent haloperoxidase [Saprospiraceae bacterium]HRG33444.1 vanadium-dependent haloperoxidase [Saprospiraceae bacterium]
MTSKLTKLTTFLLLLGMVLVNNGCKNDTDTNGNDTSIKKVSDYPNEAVYEWNELFLKIERYAAGYRPGPAPTALAYMGFAVYEATAPGFSEYKSIQNHFPEITIPKIEDGKEYHWPTVVNAVYGNMMPRFFVDQPQEHKGWMTTLDARLLKKYREEASDEVIERSRKRGQEVGEAVWKWFTTDLVAYNHYKDPFQGYDWQANYKKEGDWKPTPPGPNKPMGGVYGRCRTFVLQGNAEKTSRKPLPYSTDKNSPYYGQAYEVITRNNSLEAEEDQWVGEFWSDDLLNQTFSPGPRWIAIGDQVLKNENSNLEIAIAMSAKVGIALHEAAVACWYSKYYYNVERPQTFINKYMDPTWVSSLIYAENKWVGFTPPFPAYPSGHSTMGAAGAEALGSIFGYAYGMTDYCHQGRAEFNGTPRTFGSFFEMAQENAWSRVPLGVHWRMDCEEGVRFGTEIARKMNSRIPWKG